MKALTFSSFGGPEVLEYIEVPDPVLKADEILVKTEAIGLNFADIYRRKGNYHLKGNPPYIAGYEGAGAVVNANGHAGFKTLDRIGFADVPHGNAELVAVPIAMLFHCLIQSVQKRQLLFYCRDLPRSTSLLTVIIYNRMR